jgi:hypothetical protein
MFRILSAVFLVQPGKALCVILPRLSLPIIHGIFNLKEHTQTKLDV